MIERVGGRGRCERRVEVEGKLLFETRQPQSSLPRTSPYAAQPVYKLPHTGHRPAGPHQCHPATLTENTSQNTRRNRRLDASTPRMPRNGFPLASLATDGDKSSSRRVVSKKFSRQRPPTRPKNRPMVPPEGPAIPTPSTQPSGVAWVAGWPESEASHLPPTRRWPLGVPPLPTLKLPQVPPPSLPGLPTKPRWSHREASWMTP